MKLRQLLRDLVNDARVGSPDDETTRAADTLRRLAEAREWGDEPDYDDDLRREVDRCKDLVVAQYLREHAG